MKYFFIFMTMLVSNVISQIMPESHDVFFHEHLNKIKMEEGWFIKRYSSYPYKEKNSFYAFVVMQKKDSLIKLEYLYKENSAKLKIFLSENEESKKFYHKILKIKPADLKSILGGSYNREIYLKDMQDLDKRKNDFLENGKKMGH